MTQGILFKTGEVLIVSEINKIIPEDYNDPDLELIEPYIMMKTITEGVYIKPYLTEYTNQKIFSVRSDDILTMFSPKEHLIEEYKKNTLKEEQLQINIDTVEEEKE